MNDFTKEELQDLYTLINFTKRNMDLTPRISIGFYEKIISMIDNYRCKHERTSPAEALNMPLHCLDCGEKFE